jgi:hypothetical protein
MPAFRTAAIFDFMTPRPAISPAIRSVSQAGYALLSPPEFAHILQLDLGALDELRASWSDLPKDAYLRDGGNYRSRRHSCFIQSLPGGIAETRHRAHWQSTDYNALHGGIERWFEPIAPAVRANPAWLQLLAGFGELFATLRATPRWFIEAHQFRIDTAEGIGRPTPEGAHRDGVDFVVVMLVERRSVRGGETRVFQARGSTGVRFTMTEPWTALLLNDADVIHETTPIQPEGTPGVRDTLVITYRAEGFQAPAGPP